MSLSALALSTPSISSSSHPDQEQWYRSNDISLSWSSSDATSYAFVLDSEPETSPSGSVSNETSIDYPNKKAGVYFFHVRAKSGSNWSDTAHFKINIDTQGPSRPTELRGEALDDGSIRISWKASEDELSGVSHYNIYRSILRYVIKGSYLAEFSIRDAVAKRIAVDLTETEYIDSNVEDGRNYHYKIQPADNADNNGSVSSVVSVKAKSFCDADFEASDPFIEEGILEMSFYAEPTNVKRVKIFLVYPDSFEEQIFDGGATQRETIDVNKDFTGLEEGLYVFRIEAEDLEGDECLFEENYFFDTHSPTVSIVEPTGLESLEETVSVKVRVSDEAPSSGISQVEFFWDEGGFKKIGEVFEEEDNLFVFSWDTLNHENARSKLKVKATDRAGNYVETEKLFTIKNTINLRRDINALYDEFDSLLDDLNESREILLLFSFDSTQIDSLQEQAEQELSESMKLFNSGIDFAKSKRHAEAAVDLLVQANSAITIERKPSENYSFDRSSVNEIYSEAGLLPEFISDATENVSSFGYSRKLFLYKISDENHSEYFALIKISLYNGADEAKQVKLLEPIPEEFASDSSMIYSSNQLTWLEEDFVFVTDLNLAERKTTELTYILNKPVGLQEIDAVSDSVNSFMVPSIIISSDKNVPSRIFFPPLIPGMNRFINPVIEFFSFNGAVDGWLVLLILGLVVLLVGVLFVVVIAALLYFLFFRKKKTGF
jgi:hypothetical protein